MTPRARAFTLIEAIVVMVIIAILATMITPRVLNIGRRQVENESRLLQRMLTVAAEKCDVWNQNVALDYKSKTQTFSVWTMREDAKADPTLTGSARVKWAIDPLVETVVLTQSKLQAASQDGQLLPSGDWRVTFTPGQPRTVLSLTLEPNAGNGSTRYTLGLAPESTGATRVASDQGGSTAGKPGVASRSIDLDDAGKGQSPW